MKEALQRVVNIEHLQDDRIGDMNKIVSIYLKYIHNLDITLGHRLGDPTKLTKYKFNGSRELVPSHQ